MVVGDINNGTDWRSAVHGQEVVIHGWVYGLHNGLINDLRMTVVSPDQVQAVFDQALASLQQRHAQPGSATSTGSR